MVFVFSYNKDVTNGSEGLHFMAFSVHRSVAVWSHRDDVILASASLKSQCFQDHVNKSVVEQAWAIIMRWKILNGFEVVT